MSLFTKTYLESIWEDTINSIEELKDFYSRCNYGTEGDQQFNQQHWHFQSPAQTIEKGIAICYDTAAMTHEYFEKWNIEHICLFAFTKRSMGQDYNDDPTHTFVIYKDQNNEWRWLEGSWQDFKNNDWVESDSDTLIKNIGKALANDLGQTYYISVINHWPDYGVSMSDFYHILKAQIYNPKYQIEPDGGTNE